LAVNKTPGGILGKERESGLLSLEASSIMGRKPEGKRLIIIAYRIFSLNPATLPLPSGGRFLTPGRFKSETGKNNNLLFPFQIYTN
jgi:hypothetical protein